MQVSPSLRPLGELYGNQWGYRHALHSMLRVLPSAHPANLLYSVITHLIPLTNEISGAVVRVANTAATATQITVTESRSHFIRPTCLSYLFSLLSTHDSITSPFIAGFSLLFNTIRLPRYHQGFLLMRFFVEGIQTAKTVPALSTKHDILFTETVTRAPCIHFSKDRFHYESFKCNLTCKTVATSTAWFLDHNVTVQEWSMSTTISLLGRRLNAHRVAPRRWIKENIFILIRIPLSRQFHHECGIF
jgi:hypothetical protein